MTKEIIQKLAITLAMLPEEKVLEIANFVLKKHQKYTTLIESEINSISLAFTEVSFKDDWELDDQEKNDYWDSFK
jgi:hypothetical protein